MANQPKSFRERLVRRILASRFLTISALLHLLLVFFFGGKALYNRYVAPPDFVSTGRDFLETSDNAPAPPPASPADTLPPAPSANIPPPPAAAAPAAALRALTSLSPIAFEMQAPVLAPPTIASAIISQAQPGQAFGMGSLPALPASMAGRGEGGRSAAGQRYGQASNSETAVLRALRWLQARQQPDGTWGNNFKGAMTGLALLCYLGHGETPDTSREFGQVVENAINALIAQGTDNAGRFSYSRYFEGNPAAYQHAICTYALCETYTMTRNEKLPPIIKEAIGYILENQLPSGGWVYSYGPGNGRYDLDASVTGWQIQALKAAHLTGIPGMDGIPDALDRAVKGLDSLFNPEDGSYGYHKAGDRNYTLTGVGVLCKLLWQGHADATVREALDNIISKSLNYDSADANLYTWYYDTQACFQAQGDAWDWWNRRFQAQLVYRQNGDGSWPRTGSAQPGNMNSADVQATVYRTALCTLMLEVFYRYLPTTKDNAIARPAA